MIDKEIEDYLNAKFGEAARALKKQLKEELGLAPKEDEGIEPEASEGLSTVGMPSINELIAKKEDKLKSTVPIKDEYQALKDELDELRKEKEALGYKRK